MTLDSLTHICVYISFHILWHIRWPEVLCSVTCWWWSVMQLYSMFCMCICSGSSHNVTHLSGYIRKGIKPRMVRNGTECSTNFPCSKDAIIKGNVVTQDSTRENTSERAEQEIIIQYNAILDTLCTYGSIATMWTLNSTVATLTVQLVTRQSG